MKTQEVDLSKLKAGDTVHFRCGGKAVVGTVRHSLNSRSNEVKFIGYDGLYVFFYNEKPHRLLDIISIEPAFRWEDVKPGMAFFDYERDILFYIGPDFEGGAVFSLGPSVNDETTWFVNKEDLKDLTPAPEHDIEVAK